MIHKWIWTWICPLRIRVDRQPYRLQECKLLIISNMLFLIKLGEIWRGRNYQERKDLTFIHLHVAKTMIFITLCESVDFLRERTFYIQYFRTFPIIHKRNFNNIYSNTIFILFSLEIYAFRAPCLICRLINQFICIYMPTKQRHFAFLSTWL